MLATLLHGCATIFQYPKKNHSSLYFSSLNDLHQSLSCLSNFCINSYKTWLVFVRSCIWMDPRRKHWMKGIGMREWERETGKIFTIRICFPDLYEREEVMTIKCLYSAAISDSSSRLKDFGHGRTYCECDGRRHSSGGPLTRSLLKANSETVAHVLIAV